MLVLEHPFFKNVTLMVNGYWCDTASFM